MESEHITTLSWQEPVQELTGLLLSSPQEKEEEAGIEVQAQPAVVAAAQALRQKGEDRFKHLT